MTNTNHTLEVLQLALLWAKVDKQTRNNLIEKNTKLKDLEYVSFTMSRFEEYTDRVDLDENTKRLVASFCYLTDLSETERQSLFNSFGYFEKGQLQAAREKVDTNMSEYLNEKCPFCRGQIARKNMTCESCNTGFAEAPQAI